MARWIIAVSLPGTTTVAIYLGNCNGTFQSPKTTTLNLPAETIIPGTPIVAADFNHDGKLDLVVATQMSNGGPWGVYLLQGDGTGGFAEPTLMYTPTSGWAVQTLVIGDFDTDGNADVAVLEESPCSNGTPGCPSNVAALFGNGAASFDAIDVTTASGAMTLGSADVNSDGTTDLFGIEYGSNQLGSFLGNHDRKFSYFYTPLPDTPGLTVASPVVAADFDGDRPYMDLAALLLPTAGSSQQPEMLWFIVQDGFYCGSCAPYEAETGVVPFTGSTTYPWYVGPAVGMFIADMKADILVDGSSGPTSSTSSLVTGLNDIDWLYGASGYCDLPATGRGILLCSPASETTSGQAQTGGVGGETMIAASANSFGMLRKVEFWLDGKKMGEEHNVSGPSAWFAFYLTTPAAGTTHSGTIYALTSTTLSTLRFHVYSGQQMRTSAAGSVWSEYLHTGPGWRVSQLGTGDGHCEDHWNAVTDGALGQRAEDVQRNHEHNLEYDCFDNGGI